MTSLAERLGYRPDAKLLIVNCDDLGMCQAVNVGVYEALRDGIATSASLMVPAPWARCIALRIDLLRLQIFCVGSLDGLGQRCRRAYARG